jgi:hypothetical protein
MRQSMHQKVDRLRGGGEILQGGLILGLATTIALIGILLLILGAINNTLGLIIGGGIALAVGIGICVIGGVVCYNK